MTQKLLSDEELRTFYVENCSHEMTGCEYSRLTNIAKRGIDKLVDDTLLPVFNTQKLLYGEMRIEEELSSRREEDDRRAKGED